MCGPKKVLTLSRKVDECKPLVIGTEYDVDPVTAAQNLSTAIRQGLTLVHVRAQLEQLQDTFMS